MKYKYLVIADEDTVLGFGCAGIPGVAVSNSQQAIEALHGASAGGVGVVVVTEEIARMMRGEIDAIRFNEELPMVVEIPGSQGPLPDRRTLADIIREAVGIKV